MPATTYLYSFWMMWSAAIVLLSFRILWGWRHAPFVVGDGSREYRLS